ncbi:MAG: SLC13 family permease [Pseudomonadota bacterium]
MDWHIAAVYLILLVSLALFITEKIRVDLVALLVLCTLTLFGLVTPAEAFSGFSNPAVITVWAMFIVSSGLTRTGIAKIIGRHVLRLAGTGEVRLISVIMLTSAFLSAFMNNIGVAALLLPVVIDLSRTTGIAPSRLLLPLALSSLLGGLTTMVGTPPNLLVSMALGDAGYERFELFDFTPLGLLIVLAAIGFFLLLGRRLLPTRSPARELAHRPEADLQARYRLKERTFTLVVPRGSHVANKTIAESRLTNIAGLKVIAAMQYGKTKVLPSSDYRLLGGQRLLVQGRLDRFKRLKNWNELIVSRERSVLWDLVSDEILLFEVQLSPTCSMAGQPLDHAAFREKFLGNVLAVRRGDDVRREGMARLPLDPGDRLLIQGGEETLNRLEKSTDFDECFDVTDKDLVDDYEISDQIFVIRVPSDSAFVGKPLYESGIGDLFDFRLLGTIRGTKLDLLPGRDELVTQEDRWLIQGDLSQVDVLRGLQELEIDTEGAADLDELAADKIALVEAMLAPRSGLARKTIADIQFEEKYGLEVLAVWRQGENYRSELSGMSLELGDAFLLMGPRDKLELLQNDPEFLVLTPVSTGEEENTSKAWIATSILAGFVVAILSGALTIEVAAVLAASLMALTRCLTMEEAYQAIEWRSIFLIAGMLPLGIALQTTGAAAYTAGQLMNVLGDASPWVVIFSFYLMTAMATLFIPTAALVVLMAPIVLTASNTLGISPEPGMMAIAIAASASFASPVSHPANLLVMGPGGYKFADYFRVGIPLTLVVFLVTVIFLPFIWPLNPA